MRVPVLTRRGKRRALTSCSKGFARKTTAYEYYDTDCIGENGLNELPSLPSQDPNAMHMMALCGASMRQEPIQSIVEGCQAFRISATFSTTANLSKVCQRVHKHSNSESMPAHP